MLLQTKPTLLESECIEKDASGRDNNTLKQNISFESLKVQSYEVTELRSYEVAYQHVWPLQHESRKEVI